MCDRCSCAHVPDHGACDVFEQGMNGRCVYCDHAEGCHPGHGQFHNGPLAPVERVTPPDSPTWPGCKWCGEPVMMYPFGPNEGQPACVCARCMLKGLVKLIGKANTATAQDPPEPLLAQALPSWHMPTRACGKCGAPLAPVAVDTGDGWFLGWDACDHLCDDPADLEAYIEWPFTGNWASVADLRRLGFRIE